MVESGERLTWAVLLGRWVAFARGALAWPVEGEGKLLRESVADVVALQAVTFALEHLGELEPAERALGLDRAAVLVERHAGALAARWADALPGELARVIEEARAALARGGG